MNDEIDDNILDHIAGATVSHVSPFDNLEVPSSTVEFDEEFYDKWVEPFYCANLYYSVDDDFRSLFREISDEFNANIGLVLLSNFDWRPRIVAAYFCAVNRTEGLLEHIGKLLLRSDVCFSGAGYCLALSQINNDKVIYYLRRYLDYYLYQPALHFDQGAVMAALVYLDKLNSTKLADAYISQWDDYIQDKPNFSLSEEIDRFENQIQVVELLRSISRY